MRVLIILAVCLVVSANALKSRRHTRVVRQTSSGGGCLYEGKVYQQGQTWTVPCKYDCSCVDGTAGKYSCTDVCPTYDNLPQGCFMVKIQNSCCSKPQCNFQTTDGGTGGMGTHTGGGGGSVVIQNGGGAGSLQTATCTDSLSNCPDYGAAMCSDPQYTPWAKDNCRKTCNLCGSSMSSGGSMGGSTGGGQMTGGQTGGTGGTGDGGFHLIMTPGGSSGSTGGSSGSTSCVDTISNCAAYTNSVCSDQQYDQWVLKNCPAFCHKCGGSGSGTYPNTGTGSGTYPNTGTGSGTYPNTGTGTGTYPNTGTGTGTYPNTGTGSGTYPNTGTGTGTYPNTGTGTNPNTGTGSGSYTGACADRIQNCAAYGQSVCTDQTYAGWVKDNCAKTCNKCSGGTITTGTNGGSGYYGPGGTGMGSSMTQTGTGSSGVVTGHSNGCAYKGQVYQQNQSWKDGCDYRCTCTDGAQGRYNCQQLCVQWDNLPNVCQMNPPAQGKCCRTPNCPSYVQLHYPANYTPE